MTRLFAVAVVFAALMLLPRSVAYAAPAVAIYRGEAPAASDPGSPVHLFSLLVPAFGATQAGLAMGLITVMAIIGRLLISWAMPADADRRLIASAGYAVQIIGCMAFIAADGASVPLLLLGVVLFGIGFGNGTWLPPLIAQVEFVGEDAPRAVALMVAISQATYAFAPVVFGMIREFAASAAGAAPGFFVVAGIVQGLAICAFLAGRRRV